MKNRRLLDGKSPQTNGSGVSEKSVSTEIGVPKSNDCRDEEEAQGVAVLSVLIGLIVTLLIKLVIG